MYEWYSMTWNDVVRKLNSDVNKGLKLEQVERLGNLRNEDEVLSFNYIKTSTLIFKQFREPWVIISFLDVILFGYLSQWILLFIFALIITINISIVVSKRKKREKELEELEKFHSYYAKVLREGKFLRVAPSELVIGDIVYLEKGDVVPADLRIIECESLKVDESAVTGEEYISEKYEAKILEKEIPLLEMKNILFKASTIVAGSGEAIVISTGANTEMGKRIKILLDKKNKYVDFIIKDINYILNKLSIAASLIGILFGTILYFLNHDFISSLRAFSVILVSLVPFSLMGTLYLAVRIIIKSFGKKNVTLKDLTAIKAYAEADFLCVDKIGTISERKMQVKKIFTDDRFYDSEEEELKTVDNMERIVDISILSSQSGVKRKNNDSISMLMEKALKDMGTSMFPGKDDLEAKCKKVFNVPFDSELRIMTTVNKIENNYRANIKGPVDVLITKCKYIMKNGIEKEINEWDIASIRKAEATMGKSTLNTLGFAYRNFSYEPSLSENIESNLVFVGVVGFYNETAEETYEAIRFLRDENIKCAVTTEESKLVAYLSGKQSGILGENQFILSGEDIEKLKEIELKDIIGRTTILSNITYDQKNKVIMLAQQDGKVAATASKLAELPALKSASVGIGIGEGCSSIVRKLCDIWILDNSLNSIVNLKKDTYRILSSITKAVSYTFTCLFAQGIFIILSLFFGYSDLNYFSKIIFINFALMVLNSIFIASGYEKETIEEKAHLFQQYVIRKNKWKREVFSGAFIALLAFVLSKYIRIGEIKAVVILVMAFVETAFILQYRKFNWKNTRIHLYKGRKNS